MKPFYRDQVRGWDRNQTGDPLKEVLTGGCTATPRDGPGVPRSSVLVQTPGGRHNASGPKPADTTPKETVEREVTNHPKDD